MASDKKTAGTEKETPTDGIDIKPWTIANNEGREVTYSTWDFAGQAVYYNTHQVTISHVHSPLTGEIYSTTHIS